MTRAYVLVTVDSGRGPAVLEHVRRLSGVASADLVTGPYDILVIVEKADSNELGRFVMNELRGIPGINNTITSIALSLETALIT